MTNSAHYFIGRKIQIYCSCTARSILSSCNKSVEIPLLVVFITVGHKLDKTASKPHFKKQTFVTQT